MPGIFPDMRSRIDTQNRGRVVLGLAAEPQTGEGEFDPEATEFCGGGNSMIIVKSLRCFWDLD